MTSRRAFLFGAGAALAAPAVVRAESLMKIAMLRETILTRVPEAWTVRTGWVVHTSAGMVFEWSAPQDATAWTPT